MTRNIFFTLIFITTCITLYSNDNYFNHTIVLNKKTVLIDTLGKQKLPLSMEILDTAENMYLQANIDTLNSESLIINLDKTFYYPDSIQCIVNNGLNEGYKILLERSGLIHFEIKQSNRRDKGYILDFHYSRKKEPYDILMFFIRRAIPKIITVEFLELH